MKNKFLILLGAAFLIVPHTAQAQSEEIRFTSQMLAECSAVFSIVSISQAMAGKSKQELQSYEIANKTFRNKAVELAKLEGRENPGQAVAMDVGENYFEMNQIMMSGGDPKQFSNTTAIRNKLAKCNMIGDKMGFLR